MKRIYYLMMVVQLFFFAGANAQNNEKLYVLSPKETVLSTFDLDKLQTITFVGQNVYFKTLDGDVKSWSFDEVSTWSFIKSENVGITPVMVFSEAKVYLDADNMIIESLTEMNAVYLYNIQGRLLQQQAPKSMSATLSMSTLPVGLYIIKISHPQGNTSVHKIIKP